MAFDVPPDGPDYKDKQWAHCALLVNAHRAGKHLVILASTSAELFRTNKVAAADKVRTTQPVPPSPK
jgi:hypothetical protein